MLDYDLMVTQLLCILELLFMEMELLLFQLEIQTKHLFLHIITVQLKQLPLFRLQNYSNTTTFKTIISRSNDTASAANATVGLYRSTSAITSLTVIPLSTLSQSALPSHSTA
jgi:hypothetical protein